MKQADKDYETSNQATDPPLVALHLLGRMAEILGVTDPDAISKLKERAEAALLEYKAHLESPPPTPTELRATFEYLSKRYRQLYQTLRQLGPAERRFLDSAGSELREIRSRRDLPLDTDEALAALSKVGILIREAHQRLPPVRKGPQPDRARWYFVHRLGLIYGQTVRTQDDIEKGLYALPTRRYDAYQGHEYGPFRDFVIVAHEALGFENPERGVDDVIRSVWGGMGKKRRH